MLRQLRQKKVMKKILWVLAILIIPAFVLWGATGLRDQPNHAGMVFGKKVLFSEYREAYNAVRNRALMTYGSKFYDMQEKLNLEEETWSYIIMLEEAKKKRIKVSD
ncbi:MAG: SurA N-terminal domain-containing protein, partial [Candidatus Omnitrophica bacterium]|nr:SurA N-terminal domain-containing protein [Candidatus Omnitrophota bacterium]